MNDRYVTVKVVNDVQKAISSGCRMLAIREHSEKQIRTKLIKKGYSQEAVNASVTYLIDENWLSESRFCNAFIRSRASKGQGLVRINFELQQQGILQSLINAQLGLEDIDWQQVCEDTLLKKLCSNSKKISAGRIGFTEPKPIPLNNNERAKLESFLRYRGFSSEQIKRAVKRNLIIEH